MTSAAWFTVRDLAARLHVRPLTAWRLLRPHRALCHLKREGSHPRLVLWVPFEVVRLLEHERGLRPGPDGAARGEPATVRQTPTSSPRSTRAQRPTSAKSATRRKAVKSDSP